MRKFTRTATMALASTAMAASAFSIPVQAQEQSDEYVIYPAVQSITYKEGSSSVTETVNVVASDAIDAYTKAYMEEVFGLLSANLEYTDTIAEDKTNVLVGTVGDGGLADQYFSETSMSAEDLFEKNDAYALEIGENTIAVLGKDTDAAFYGIASLYHIFTQVQNREVRSLHIEDFADVKTRGFIEGYYGNPWSHEDRIDLMTWSRHYKLNGYFYAPKDDPKHNSKWRELYTEEELQKHQELAQAGNASKCYYIYALHPFMYSAVNFKDDEQYEEDLQVIKDKFEQLMSVGVKQFAILADDAAVPYGGGASYVRLMNDLTDWIKEKQKEYEGVKDTLIFCPNDYYGKGTSAQMQAIKDMPENVSIIQTGGAIWGSVSTSFNDTFYENMGRPAFMWINWPCSDNTKDGLILGGAQTVLKPGVNPDTVDGIVLNPMQQSEPSKQGLFTNADYAWNIWETADRYDQVWNDSFNFIDHDTVYDSEGSAAYRELAKHMQNSARLYNEESVDIKDDLALLISKLQAGEPAADLAAQIKTEFETLNSAAQTYSEKTGNPRTLEQISYWIDSWKELSRAVNDFLDAVILMENDGDPVEIWNLYAKGSDLRDASLNHSFWYVDHYENARPGRKYIVPFMNNLYSVLSSKVLSMVNPNINLETYITNRMDTPSADTSYITDNNAATGVIYKTPNTIEEGTYVGIAFSRPKDVNSVLFRTGQSSNENDTFSKAIVQYTHDGKEWINYGEEITSPAEVAIDGMELKDVKGVRLIATETKENTWLGIKDIVINPDLNKTSQIEPGTLSTNNLSVKGGSLSLANDAAENTFVHFAEGNYKQDQYQDYIPVDASVTITYPRAQRLSTIHFLQDAGSDKLSRYAIEYTEDGSEWKMLGEYAGDAEVTLNVYGDNISAKAIRVRNLELNIQSGKTSGWWWKLYDFRNMESSAADPEFTSSSPNWYWYSTYGSIGSLTDGDLTTFCWTGDTVEAGDTLTWDLQEVKPVGQVDIAMGYDGEDKFVDYVLEYSQDGENWTLVNTYKGVASGQDVYTENLNGAKARYVRIRNLTARNTWQQIAEFKVQEFSTDDGYSLEYAYSSPEGAADVKYEEGSAALRISGSLSLKPEEYIGVDLKEIRDITGISKAMNDLKVQVSKNGYDWMDVSSDWMSTSSQAIKGRYVRFVNDKESAVSVSQKEDSTVTFNTYPGAYLLDDTVGITSGSWASEDSRYNGAAFDKNISTDTEFANLPAEGSYILYDLGQWRDIYKLALYSYQSAYNYIRDAIISVSPDMENWTDVVTIGDGIENTSDANVKAIDSDAGYKPSSTYPNYVYIDGEVDLVPARYVKITFTADNRNRAVLFNEIVINDGEYIATPNPAITTTAGELEGYAPANMFDDNLTTSWKPAGTESGSLIYEFSEVLTDNRINIVQKGEISNAKISVLAEKDGERMWIPAGILDTSFNQLGINADKLFALRIEWNEGMVPEIAETVFFTGEALPDYADQTAAVEKDSLFRILNLAAQIMDGYTSFPNVGEMDKEQFKEITAQAKAVYENPDATQKETDAAYLMMLRAWGDLQQTERTNALQKAIESVEKILENEDEYESEGIAALKAALEEAKAAFTGEYGMEDKAREALIEAAGNLVRKDKIDTSLLQVLVSELSALKEADYTPKTWEVFAPVYKEAKAVLEVPESQTAVDTVFDALEAARGQLALVPDESTIQTLKEFALMVKDLDTENNPEAALEQIEEANQAVIAGLENENLTRKEADDLLALVQKVQDLIDRTGTKPPMPGDETEPETPETGNKEDSEKPKEEDKTPEPETPETEKKPETETPETDEKSETETPDTGKKPETETKPEKEQPAADAEQSENKGQSENKDSGKKESGTSSSVSSTSGKTSSKKPAAKTGEATYAAGFGALGVLALGAIAALKRRSRKTK